MCKFLQQKLKFLRFGVITIILVINLGSSSLRFSLFSLNNLSGICNGVCENIGSNESIIRYIYNDKTNTFKKHIENHRKAFSFVKELLLYSDESPVKYLNDIKIIGHRVVHGGRFFHSPVIINSDIIDKIKDLVPLAPIHNSINLEGILDCKLEFEGIPQVAVFDTSFFYNLPEKSRYYPISDKLSKKYKIERYGFHGISHDWAYMRHENISGKMDCKVISCHLGSGSSVCAIDNGKPIDISMGLTPLGGLMMGTRSGSMDPSVVTYLASQSGMNLKEINNILNKESGLIGVSGFSNDIRELIKKGDKKCNLALDMYIYKIVKYIGSYFVSLGGIDSIVFTGGIGENSTYIRGRICKYLKFLGVILDNKRNSIFISGKEGIISDIKSSILIGVVKTNEELAIATKIFKMFGNDVRNINK